ncbi:MAG TPA: hypothetical protein DCY13_13825 [Verrucomicrobiales bacterium]|nr:hypothetical protein [Verrucomicrobiales bacterium]
MNTLPVIERELICESRSATNYWLRLIGAGALLALGGLYLLEGNAGSRWDGAMLFSRMNLVLQLTIFVLVPILTADSVAREKREGTLGLLFLTPLRSRDIVVGKGLVLAVRSLTVLFATLPMLCLPLMMGGVSGAYVLHAAAMDFCALCLALAAGLHASVRQVEWFRAAAHALGMSAIAAFFFFSCSAPILAIATRAFHAISALFMLPLGVIVLWATIGTSATWLARNWRREILRPPQPGWVQVFDRSPLARGLFRWNRKKTLDRNPVAWLQERSWTARLTKWGWFLLILSTPVWGGCLGGFYMDYPTWLGGLTLLLAGGMAFTATASFRNERSTGALELLLVTPLTSGQILRGRMWGLVAHFLPATLMLGFYWFVPLWFGSKLRDVVWLNGWFGFSTLATIPLVGLWFALGRLHYVAAWLVTLLLGYVVPYGAALTIQIIGGRDVASLVLAATCFTAMQILQAAECFRRLRRALEDRSFATPDE